MFKLFILFTCIISLFRFTSHEPKGFNETIDLNVNQEEGPKIWNNWGKWSRCSVTCGAGTLSRWRYCIAGGCSFDEKQAQFKTCTLPACESSVQGAKIWDQWSKWACCSTSCGPGKTIRWRHCLTGGCASGEKEAQIRTCQLESCN